MFDDFIEVKGYKCKYCGELFATTRHDCKWKPAKRNCLTCKHCDGFIEGQGFMYDLECFGFVDYEPSYFICKLDIEGCNDIADLSNNKWSLGCDDYEKAETDDYRKRYWEIIRSQSVK